MATAHSFATEERDLLARFSHKPHAIVWNKNDLAGMAIRPIELQLFPKGS